MSKVDQLLLEIVTLEIENNKLNEKLVIAWDIVIKQCKDIEELHKKCIEMGVWHEL